MKKNRVIIVVSLVIAVLIGCKIVIDVDEKKDLEDVYYDESMDYESFLKFNGIISEADFNGDGKKDYLKRKTIANIPNAIYYIEFAGDDNVLFLGEFLQGYMLDVKSIDIDRDGLKELIVLGMNDHSYDMNDTAVFEIYRQNIWDKDIYWESVRLPKGEQLMNQGLDWNLPYTYSKKSGFDCILLQDANNYIISLDDGITKRECQIKLSDNWGNELVNTNISKPIYKYEISNEDSTIMYLYQQLEVDKNYIGTAVTTINWFNEKGLINYNVQAVEVEEL